MATQEDTEELREQVWNLSADGNSVDLKVLLEEHPEVKVDGDDWRALDTACLSGHTECARLLIDHKADVNAIDGDDWSALHYAAQCGGLSCVNLLVQNGADVNYCHTEDNWTPLMACGYNGGIAVAHHLLEHKADIHYRALEGDDKNQDALHCAMAKYATHRTPGIAFAFLSCNTDAKNVHIDKVIFHIDSSVTAAIRDAHIEEYEHVHAYIDEYHGILEPVLSEHVPVDPRFGLGQMGIYQEPLERTLEYLGLSMSKNQVVNTSIDGEDIKRALSPGHLLNANHWFDKYKSR
jgi:hypothetical protein